MHISLEVLNKKKREKIVIMAKETGYKTLQLGVTAKECCEVSL
jgi:hypothetical protein